MAWQDRNESRLPHVGAAKSWADRRFRDLSAWEMERKRLSLMLNLIVLDHLLVQQGYEPMLSTGEAIRWEQTYNHVRGTHQRPGRPTTSSQDNPLIEKGKALVTRMSDLETGPIE